MRRRLAVWAATTSQNSGSVAKINKILFLLMSFGLLSVVQDVIVMDVHQDGERLTDDD